MKLGSLRNRPKWRKGRSVLASGLAAIHAAEELASEDGRVAGAADVLALGCDLNEYDQDGFSALHCAATAGSVDKITRLLKYGATGCQVTEEHGKNLIHVAAGAGCLEVVQWATIGGGRQMLGLDPKTADLAGFSPFFVAIENHRPEVVRWLLEAGVATIADRTLTRKTALMIAVTCPTRCEVQERGQEVLDANLSQVKNLASYPGQDIEWKCPTGHSAVFLALYRGQPAVVYYLLDKFEVSLNRVVVEDRALWWPLGMRVKNVRAKGRLFTRREEEDTLMMNMARREPFELSHSDSRMLLRSRTLVSLNLGIKMRAQGHRAMEDHRVATIGHCPFLNVLADIVADYGRLTIEDLAASNGALLGETLPSTFVYELLLPEGPAPNFIDLTGQT
jgi:ankyrin repeat protein